jgi:hypothetical protein
MLGSAAAAASPKLLGRELGISDEFEVLVDDLTPMQLRRRELAEIALGLVARWPRALPTMSCNQSPKAAPCWNAGPIPRPTQDAQTRV